ncbi:hypothetical protein FNV43_RR00348 [Rhamnella rubrinervis]|uniref:Uncharacterized protein n=1 Tax=Rhamnella rubrinervis TaxID=2594499 RepID=A0A8K0MR31_9ROSA|nr:hypothetical protein FNV43_RR00348 [Rhamnella rubrinervis]
MTFAWGLGLNVDRKSFVDCGFVDLSSGSADELHRRDLLLKAKSYNIFQQFVALPREVNSLLLFVDFSMGVCGVGICYYELGAKASLAMATEKKVASGPGFEVGASNELHAWIQEPVTGLEVPLQTKAGSSLKKVSFAEVVGGDSRSQTPLTIQDSHSSLPIEKGNLVSIRVNDAAYQEHVALCQFSLIARIILSKGEKPWKFDDLYTKLQSIWKLEKWQLISLGRGFFHMLLCIAEDRQKLGILASSHLTDLARGIGTPLKFDHSTIACNYGHYARVLVDVDLAGFVLKILLLETTDDCIEVDLYFESFPNFCTSCHSVAHSMAKCKSMIGTASANVGSHGKENVNKALGLTQVWNTDVTPTPIEEIDHQQVAVLFNMANTHIEMGINVQSTALDLGAAPNRTDFNTDMDDELGDDADDILDVGQHSYSVAMVLFNLSGSLTAVQQNLDLVASHTLVSETTYQNLWNIVERKPG